MTRANTSFIVAQLHALGFSMTGAQQLVAGRELTDARDRRHLVLFLAGLFEGGAIRAGAPTGRHTVKTQSGIVIELEDDSGQPGTQQRASRASAGRGTTPSVQRTASGVVISFEDDA